MAHRAPKPPTPGPGASSVQAPRRFLLKDNEPSWLLLAQAKDSVLTRDGHWHRVRVASYCKVLSRGESDSESPLPVQVRRPARSDSELDSRVTSSKQDATRLGCGLVSRARVEDWGLTRSLSEAPGPGQGYPGIGSIAAVPGRPRSQVVSAAAAAERTLTDSVVAVCIEVCLLRPSRRLLSSSDRAPCC